MKILTIANIVPRKRIDLCALACQELVTRHDVSGIKWTVIGRGSKESEVKSLAPISMEFIPVVENLKAFYKRADVFVLPSCDEGFGMVYIEAIMCGCPVICRKNDGGQEIVDTTGGGIAVDIPESNEQSVRNIVKGIDRIILNRSQYTNEQTRKLAVEMVSPEKIKKQWAELVSHSIRQLS
ncbi:MAG TPA: glycosyltransferase family 4 protein [candidate division Zixibacteria bacterium]|nr:glycosyltransferase family 4 protein [candidate division Zixibacteria bacterium]